MKPPINHPWSWSNLLYLTTLLNRLSYSFHEGFIKFNMYQIKNNNPSIKDFRLESRTFSILYHLKIDSHNHHRTHPLTSIAALEYLFPKITDFVAITSMGCTWRSFLISWTTASDTLWRKSFFLYYIQHLQVKSNIYLEQWYR